MGFLRLLLAAIVAFDHSAGRIFPTIGGYAAVELFFIISGFYMAATYERHYRSAFAFMASRYLRLLPLYAAALLIGIFAWVLAPVIGLDRSSMPQLSAYLNSASPLVHIATWSLLGQDVLSLDLAYHIQLPNPAAWSLSAELIFYALVPALLMSGRWLPVIGIAAFAIKIVSFEMWGFRAAYFPFWSQIGYFILGFWLFRFKDWLRFPKLISVFGLGAYMIALLTIDQASLEYQNITRHLTVVLPLCLLLPALFALPTSRLDRWAGDLSYGLYTAHFIVINIVRGAGLNPLGSIPWALAVIAISMGFAFLFELYAQHWIDNWRRRKFYGGSGSARRAVDTRVEPVLGHNPGRVAVKDHV